MITEFTDNSKASSLETRVLDCSRLLDGDCLLLSLSLPFSFYFLLSDIGGWFLGDGIVIVIIIDLENYYCSVLSMPDCYDTIANQF